MKKAAAREHTQSSDWRTVLMLNASNFCMNEMVWLHLNFRLEPSGERELHLMWSGKRKQRRWMMEKNNNESRSIIKSNWFAVGLWVESFVVHIAAQRKKPTLGDIESSKNQVIGLYMYQKQHWALFFLNQFGGSAFFVSLAISSSYECLICWHARVVCIMCG